MTSSLQCCTAKRDTRTAIGGYRKAPITLGSELERADLAELHYITPLANIRSILERGILSHVRAQKFKPASIAAQEIQNIRAAVRLPTGRRLHEYANLYFHARNPMMYKRRAQHADICVLRVGVTVLDVPGTIITNANASSRYVRFSPSPGGLVFVNEELTYAENWKNPDDQIDEWQRTSAKCAEVLVPDRVDVSLITGAYVSCQESKDKFDALEVGVPSNFNAELFFR